MFIGLAQATTLVVVVGVLAPFRRTQAAAVQLLAGCPVLLVTWIGGGYLLL